MASKQITPLVVICSIALFFLLSQERLIGMVTPVDEALSLSVRINNQDFFLGDEVKIDYCFKNNSNHKITVIKWRGAPYPTSNLKFLDENGQSLKVVRTAYYELALVLPKEAFVTLGPGEEYCVAFSGIIDKEREEEIGENGSKKIILRFSDCYIILEGFNRRFQIMGKYGVDDTDRSEWQKLYEFSNLWSGKLYSQPVNFVVEDAK